MSKIVLGISAFYHDSAAAIVRDGDIVAAAQEERFTRKKHDPRFPVNAINYCLEEAFVDGRDVDAVVYYDNPCLTLDRLFKDAVTCGQGALQQFEKGATAILGHKIWLDDHVAGILGCHPPGGHVLIADHHMAHAASAFFPSPFGKAAILTLDGVGEWMTTGVAVGRDRRIDMLSSVNYPHSLGLLYSAFTHFCGFKVNSGEYKLMGLAPYGEPKYAGLILDKLLDLKPDGSFRLNMAYFGYRNSGRMITEAFEDLFGGPARKQETRISRREMDLAASIQSVTEEVVLRMARHARAETGMQNLCLAGGVALNCVANGRILRERIFDEIWIQPAAGDAGGALGAALLGAHALHKAPRHVTAKGDRQKGSYLGPAFSSAEIRAFLDLRDIPYRRIENSTERSNIVAEELANGRIVGFFSGRMEFGPRSLGSRSILGDPRNRDMQSVMNLKIKFRESFRPFAPAVLEEACGEYFDLDVPSPYMLLVAPVNEERRISAAGLANDDDMLPVINRARSDIPAVTHVDYSARVQTVSPDVHPGFRALLEAFRAKTGCAVLVNTSFNVRGEPIVCTPDDAYRCFMRTEMDILVLEDCVLWKRNQPATAKDESWKTEYELD